MRALVVNFLWLTAVVSCFVAEARLEPDGTILLTVLCLPTALVRNILPYKTDLTWFFATSAVLIFTYAQLLELLKYIEEAKSELRKLRKRRGSQS